MNQADSEIYQAADSPAAGQRLSPQQAHLWELHKAGSTLRACCVVEIAGPLDPVKLRQAVSRVTETHPILRSTLVRQPGIALPLQAPGDDVAWSETLNLAHLSAAEQTVALDEIWTAQIECRDDWELGPALTAQLVHLSEAKSQLLLNLCPLFGDGFTLGLLVKAITTAYAALPDANALLSEGLQYDQFAEWQNELRETEEVSLQEARTYWSTRPAGLATSGFPAQQDLPHPPGFVPDRVATRVEDDVIGAIAVQAAECNVTVNEFLFATWCAFLWRWTKFSNASIGYISDGRPFEELQEVLGLVARCLPIGVQTTGASPFRSLCLDVQTRLAEAFEWQDYFLFAPTSLEDTGVLPSPNFGFQYEERHSAQTAGDLLWTICRQDCVLEPHALHLACIREGSALRAELVYDTTLYNRVTAERLLHEWLMLTQDAATHADREIDRLALLDEDERTELLVRLNDTTTSYPHTKCFHELFEEQAQRTPDSIAIRFGTAQITYRELNEQADRLAAHLEEYGVRPEQHVAICLTRSPEMIVAILGVLKAGGAYVPLDASYPLDRLAWILEDSTPVLIIATPDLYDRLPGSNIPVLSLEESLRSSQSAELGDRMRPGPHNLAYIIYTSGSTGRPKGVMVPHQGVVNYLHWCSHAYQLTAGKGTLVDTPIGFDLTVTSLLAPLLVGQTAVLVPETNGIEALAEALRSESDVTLVKTTPAHMEVLRNLLPEAAAGASRRFVIGGEALKWETLSYWRAHAPETKWVNEYGPTETVVGCCTYEVPESVNSGSSVPIGRPIANTRLYLLDDHLQPVAKGMPGELYIGGAGVVRGYLNRPDLTAERFIPDAFGDEPGGRLYKTGDLCRYLTDGNIEYLGRTDHQVKIRGFRIELGEIETVVMLQRGVREAVVTVREDNPGDKRLVAYIVVQDASLDCEELRERLREKLPEYMTPNSIVVLAQLPLTPNGKIDREALPTPERAALTHAYVAPRNAVEQILAGIWEELLGFEQLDVHQDFFTLGGHSLLATQAISYVKETFQVDVPLLALFQAPSVAAFAELLLQDPAKRSQIESMADLMVSLSGLSEEELAERLRKIGATQNEV